MPRYHEHAPAELLGEYTIGAMFLLDSRASRVAWTVLVFAAALGLVYLLRKLLLLFVFSLFFAYLLFPVVRMVQRGLPRWGGRPLAIGVVYLLLLLALVGLGLGVGPRLTEEVELLTEKAPQMSQQIASGQIITDILQKRGWEAGRVRQVEGVLRAHAAQIIGYVQGALAAMLRWLAGAWVAVLVPIFAFFILKDAEPAVAGIDGLIEKPRHRELWRDIVEDVHLLLAKYVGALILLSLITFVAWSAVFFLAGVPYPVGLAAIGGVLEFLPIVGPLTAGVIVVSVALFSGYAHPWLLVAFVLFWRGIQDYVSSPLVMGRGIEIDPAVVIFGVIAGGEIGGPAGMFLSIPVIAALRIVWRRVRASRSGAAPASASRSPGVTGPDVTVGRGAEPGNRT
jgi:predicted PurR-regulated permease PerM